jgi:putative phosphoesterase
MIGLMSDSHDNLIAINKAISLFNQVDCSLVIHAGDIIAPFAARELRKLKCPVKAVFGNCDGEKEGLIKVFKDLGEIKPAPFVLTHDNRRLVVSHFPLEDPPEEAEVMVFGHTHRAQVSQEGNCLVINPGESGGWVRGVSTVVLLDAEQLTADIIIL